MIFNRTLRDFTAASTLFLVCCTTTSAQLKDGSTREIKEPLALDVLEPDQEVHPDIRDVSQAIEEALRDKKRFRQLEANSVQRVKLLRELKQHYASLHTVEFKIDSADDDQQQTEDWKTQAERTETRIEIVNLQLELLERRFELVELASDLPPRQHSLTTEAARLSKMLDAADALIVNFGKAMLDPADDAAEELEHEFAEFERVYQRRREILQLRFELIEAREDDDEEWIRELETSLEALGFRDPDRPQAANRREESATDLTHADLTNPDLAQVLPIQLTRAEVDASAQLDFQRDILPRLRSACFDCHDQGTAGGDLDLEGLVQTKPFVINRAHWLDVIEQLKVRSMPPADANQPSEHDRRTILGWLTDRIENFDYTTVRKAGMIPAKRLTHDEYNNTVRDLVGIDLRPADRFPPDLTASSGFKNSANSLFIQPVTMERYLGAAEAIVQEAWPLVPTTPQQRSAWKRLVGNTGNLDSHDNIRTILDRFATRAFRRPLQERELDSLMTHFQDRQRNGDTAAMALRDVLQVILISPSFLIRTESAPLRPGETVPISDWEMASRLSYFLWGSMPDEELFERARSNQLLQPEVLRLQIDRMLADPKASTLGHIFAAQWLGFAALDRVQRDQIENPWATDSLVAAMKSESALLFNAIVQRNASIDRLLDADYTFVNEELANHYRLDGVHGEQLREVSLQGTPRRGVLGHASILATTSFPRRTSPVLRGNWILTTLLGTPPPPPPPNVSEFDEHVEENDRLSGRQKLELHRRNAQCYACHSQIDPLGFALEEFEWFGRYRPKRDGKRVDAVGKLPSGTQFRGLQGLSATLLNERTGDLAQQLTRKMLTYAFGRQLEYYDEATVRELTQELETNQRKVRALIQAIIHSTTFQSKQS